MQRLATLGKNNPAIREQPTAIVSSATDRLAKDGVGGLACRPRPVPARGVGNRQERFPAVLRSIVEVLRKLRLWNREAVHLPDVARERVPERRGNHSNSRLSEPLNRFRSRAALHGDDNRSIENRIGQAADARRSFRAEDVELNQRVATPLSDGAWDGGSPAVAAIEEGTDALHGSRLVAEHCVDLVDEHGRVIAVDLPEQDRLGWTTDPPWVSWQGHAYDGVDPKRLRAADAP